MVLDRDISQRNALFDLGSLADVRQLQIALRGSNLAEPDNGETKSEWLKCDCFHIVAVTLPRFLILRYQIIKDSAALEAPSFGVKAVANLIRCTRADIAPRRSSFNRHIFEQSAFYVRCQKRGW
jgi:hypothetical protein